MDFLKQNARRVAIGILILFGGLNLIVSSQESTTMDEKAHIPASYSYVKYEDMRINPEHPPLLKDLAGFALLFLSPAPVFPLSDPLWENGDWLDVSKFPEGKARTWGLAQWAFGDKLLHENGNDADAITFASRVPIILVSVLLGWVLFLATRAVAGTLPGLFALLLFVANPNIIGHSHYVTTDIGIAAFIFIAVYFFSRFLKDPSWINTAYAGLTLGLAQLTKFSAVLLFPLFGLFVVLYALAAAQQTEGVRSKWQAVVQSLFRYLSRFTASIALCFVVISLLYTYNVWNMPGEVIAEIARAQFPNDRAVGRIAESVVVTMSGTPILKPLSEYFLGVFMVFARVAGGNTYYFLGTVSNQASAWYFPVVYVLKETIPFLFLLIGTSAYTIYRIGRAFLYRSGATFSSLLATSLRERPLQYVGAGFVLLYAYVSITGNLNIGFRHLFPILPFLMLLVAKTTFDFFNRNEHKNPVMFRFGLGLLTASIAVIPVLSYPSYLSYFNAFGGGHENGYRYVTDSNYDWGQDLKRLSQWVEQYNACVGQRTKSPECRKLVGARRDNITVQYPSGFTPIEKIRVDYFGGSNPQYYLKDKYIPWHSNNTPEAGWYAISAGFYMESIYKQKGPNEWGYEWLENIPIVTRAGDSIFIFYVDESQVPTR